MQNTNHNPLPVWPSLKNWFIVHFAIDMIVALPLLLCPTWLAEQIDLSIIDDLPLRILGAAFFAIGLHSLLMRNKSLKEFQSFLNFKILWSGTAIFASILVLIKTGQLIALISTVIFLLFFYVWSYYLYRINKAIN